MFKRSLRKVVIDASRSFPVVLITGPRQVGKTTLLKELKEPDRGYVTLDNPLLRLMAKEDPELFLQSHPAPLIIDEIQYAPELLSCIKMRVDENKKAGMYWLTGSQKFAMMQGIQESLAGRVAVLDLLGISQAEEDGLADSTIPFIPDANWIKQNKDKPQHDVKEIFWRIYRGSFPALLATESNRDLFYSSYVQTYIDRDVRDLISGIDTLAFTRFLVVLASRTGQELNYTDIAANVQIDQKTAKTWVGVLEASGLVYLLHPYSNHLTSKLVKRPKIYFLDTGLACYLTQWPSSETLEVGKMSGAILETYVVAEILKSYWNSGKRPYLYYYRDSSKQEIDLVVQTHDKLYPVEIKKTSHPTKDLCKVFANLAKFGDCGSGTVLSFVREPVALSTDTWALPVYLL